MKEISLDEGEKSKVVFGPDPNISAINYKFVFRLGSGCSEHALLSCKSLRAGTCCLCPQA
jgi:hypothetical protein